MLNLKDIAICTPKENNFLVFWFGGAGFLLKFSDGMTICIDPYLSDSVERLFGFKRLMKAPVSPENLKFDMLLISHEHGDLLDIESFETLINCNPMAKVISPQSCKDFISKYTKNYCVTKPGDKHHCGCCVVESVYANHGDLSPDAVGFIICSGGRKIYFTGDTALNNKIMNCAIKQQPDIIIPCINGAYGNMNENEAAELACKCSAKIAIPMHFGLFNEHGGNVELFRVNLAANSSEIKCIVLTPGQGTEA